MFSQFNLKQQCGFHFLHFAKRNTELIGIAGFNPDLAIGNPVDGARDDITIFHDDLISLSIQAEAKKTADGQPHEGQLTT